MALVRDIATIVNALDTAVITTCAELLSTAASTSPAPNKLHATADAVVTACAETTVFGRVIDRIGPELGAYAYGVVMPSASVYASRGSTEADRKWTLGVRLQHGDSSGAGDMADYSTENAAESITYFSTKRTSDEAHWDTGYSSGPLQLRTNPCYYDMRAAKRYIRVAIPVLKNRVTTETSGDEHARLNADLVFLAGNGVVPQIGHRAASPFASSTTT